jgi:hypothetical protein
MTLRIKIPNIYNCSTVNCIEYSRLENDLCRDCMIRDLRRVLYTWMRKEMPPTTFAAQPKLGHSTPFGRYFRG